MQAVTLTLTLNLSLKLALTPTPTPILALTVVLTLRGQVVMSEEQYQQHSRDIATQHEDPTVEGLYETQVALT